MAMPFLYDSGSFNELRGTGLDVAMSTTAIAWADYSANGAWGVAIGTSTGLAVYQADGTGVYTAQTLPASLPSQKVSSVHWADFDRDNLLDLLVLFEHGASGASSPPEAAILHNNGGDIRTWPHEILPTQGSAITRAVPIDFDLDGWVDVLLYTDNGA